MHVRMHTKRYAAFYFQSLEYKWDKGTSFPRVVFEGFFVPLMVLLKSEKKENEERGKRMRYEQ